MVMAALGLLGRGAAAAAKNPAVQSAAMGASSGGSDDSESEEVELSNMTNDITVDKLYQNFVNDPSFTPPDGVKKEDAAKKTAEQRYRQHMNNMMALTLSKGVTNKHITATAALKFADFMKSEYNIDLNISQLKK